MQGDQSHEGITVLQSQRWPQLTMHGAWVTSTAEVASDQGLEPANICQDRRVGVRAFQAKEEHVQKQLSKHREGKVWEKAVTFSVGLVSVGIQGGEVRKSQMGVGGRPCEGGGPESRLTVDGSF